MTYRHIIATTLRFGCANELVLSAVSSRRGAQIIYDAFREDLLAELLQNLNRGMLCWLLHDEIEMLPILYREAARGQDTKTTKALLDATRDVGLDVVFEKEES